MTLGQRREFDVYYTAIKAKEAEGARFDFKTEFEEYCKLFKKKKILS
jgi:hypothetical protein